MPHLPKYHSSSSESEEDDAPEAVSLSQSKKEMQKLTIERKNAEAVERKARREKNREIDRRLKERSEKNKISLTKFKGKALVVADEEDPEDSDEADDLEKRMQCAMKEAQDEEDEGRSSSDEKSDSDDEESGSDKNDDENDSDSAEDDEDDRDGEGSPLDHGDSEDDQEDHEALGAPSKFQTTKSNPDHLPDELFAAAFKSSVTANAKRKTTDQEVPATRSAKKRKSSQSKTQKDVIVGSRAIRVLPDSMAPPVPSTIPSRKIRKFLDRTLALKGGRQSLQSKGWERRPANIGVLKRDGPPASFVRNG